MGSGPAVVGQVADGAVSLMDDENRVVAVIRSDVAAQPRPRVTFRTPMAVEFRARTG